MGTSVAPSTRTVAVFAESSDRAVRVTLSAWATGCKGTMAEVCPLGMMTVPLVPASSADELDSRVTETSSK